MRHRRQAGRGGERNEARKGWSVNDDPRDEKKTIRNEKILALQ